MRILTFSTLYPCGSTPNHGIFVENRLRQLVNTQDVDATVIAPVPWFPFRSERFGTYATFAKAPGYERRFDLDIYHPRYLVLPKIGMYLTPWTLAQAGLRAVKGLGQEFDLIDAHYFFPDGVSASYMAQTLDRPFVITARGTDINFIGQMPKARRMMLNAGKKAAALITVSEALKEKMIELGFDRDKITVLRNGVDLAVFSPKDRKEAQKRFGFNRPTLLSVGRLTKAKGHHLIIEAMQHLPHYDLAIAGQGEERSNLEKLARAYKVDARVRFLGSISHDEMPCLYSAADLMILASQREGWPNVMLEALACGTPVIASNVGGIPECLEGTDVGYVLQDRNAMSIVKAVEDMTHKPVQRQDARTFAERFDWHETSKGQMELFESIVKSCK